jgi:hypothetical protein
VQKSIPTQISQIVLFVIHNEEYVDGFAGELTFSKQLENILYEMKAFPHEEGVLQQPATSHLN